MRLLLCFAAMLVLSCFLAACGLKACSCPAAECSTLAFPSNARPAPSQLRSFAAASGVYRDRQDELFGMYPA